MIGYNQVYLRFGHKSSKIIIFDTFYTTFEVRISFFYDWFKSKT